MSRLKILLLVFLAVASCQVKSNSSEDGSDNNGDSATASPDFSGILGRGASSSSSDNGPGDDLASAPDMCSAAVSHMVNDCGYTSVLDPSDYRCSDVYETCEARCYVYTPCGVLTSGGDTTLTTCLTACYADGTAMCKDAEAKTVCACDEKVAVDWNLDHYCDATEICQANCAMAVDVGFHCENITRIIDGKEKVVPVCSNCTDLLDLKGDYAECASRCKSAKLRENKKLNFDQTYCDRYVDDVHCTIQSLESHQEFCLNYPATLECQDPITYCNLHSNNSSNSPATWNDQACDYDCNYSSECWGLKHCELYPTDPLCSYGPSSVCADVITTNNVCENACKDVSTYNKLFQCYICYCGSYPSKCGYVDPDDLDDYYDEDYNPNCTDGDNFCCQYPGDPFCI